MSWNIFILIRSIYLFKSSWKTTTVEISIFLNFLQKLETKSLHCKKYYLIFPLNSLNSFPWNSTDFIKTIYCTVFLLALAPHILYLIICFIDFHFSSIDRLFSIVGRVNTTCFTRQILPYITKASCLIFMLMKQEKCLYPVIYTRYTRGNSSSEMHVLMHERSLRHDERRLVIIRQ